MTADGTSKDKTSTSHPSVRDAALSYESLSRVIDQLQQERASSEAALLNFFAETGQNIYVDGDLIIHLLVKAGRLSWDEDKLKQHAFDHLYAKGSYPGWYSEKTRVEPKVDRRELAKDKKEEAMVVGLCRKYTQEKKSIVIETISREL